MIFLLDLPKPVHGMSNVNLAIVNKTKELGLKPYVINTAPSYAAQTFGSHRWLAIKIAHTIYCYFFMLLLSFRNIRGVVYRPINGGAGQIYDLIYLAICRLFFNKIYIHHHSFNYLNKKSVLFSTLNYVAGKKTVHIALGERMANLLNQKYRIDKRRIKIVSNLSFFETQSITASDIKPDNTIILGHLANLSLDKGIGVFIDVCHNLQAKGIKFSARIAGPFSDELAQEAVMQAIKELPQIQYLGALYDDQKVSFYNSIDCFVFPSMYRNEAEPLVLYEAALSGGYLTGSRRGCMKEVIERFSGASIEEGLQMSDLISVAIMEEYLKGGFSLTARNERATFFQQEKEKAKESLLEFVKEMASDEFSKS